MHIFDTNLETWILYRGYDDGLSKIVKDAYQNYEEMEIKPEKSKTQRHVKLFSLAGNKVYLLSVFNILKTI